MIARDPFLSHALGARRSLLGPNDEPTAPVLVYVRPGAAFSPPAGCRVRSVVGGAVYSCDVTAAAAEALRSVPDVEAVSASRERGPDEGSDALAYVRAPSQPGSSRAEKGGGAMIAILDLGIDVLHQAFRGADGRPRIVEVWDQRDNSGPPPTIGGRPAYGTLHTEQDLLRYVENDAVERRLGRDALGHGTGVASIAAGAPIAPPGTFAGGVAPEARLVVVINASRTADGEDHPHGAAAGLVDALAYVDEVATAKGLPVVVNMSQSVAGGARDGSSILERACDAFTGMGQRPGRAIVKSAGNVRSARTHASVPLDVATDLDIDLASPFTTVTMDAWFEATDELSFTLAPPSGPASPPVSLAAPEVDFRTAGKNLASLRLTPFHPDNGRSHLQLHIGMTGEANMEQGRWRLTVTPVRVRSTNRLHAWIASTVDDSAYFLGADADGGCTLTPPANAHHIITVGAIGLPPGDAPPDVAADFSCAGPTRDGREAPHVVAPGVDVDLARAGQSHGHGAGTGTSMAAPHVAGAIAVLFSAWGRAKPGPMLRQGQVVQALERTARSPHTTWDASLGYGCVDIDGLLRAFGL